MAEMDRITALEQRIAELEARLEPASRPADSWPSANVPDNAGGAQAADADVARRQLLRRGSTLVAGALAGGAALTLLDGSPAGAVPPVVGNSATDDGVYGSSSANGFAGVHGTTATVGVVGVRGNHTNGGIAMLGAATGNGGVGVNGSCANTNGVGVTGDAGGTGGVGVRGSATSGTGVYGTTTSGSGVYGYSSNATGVFGQSIGNNTPGVRGDHSAVNFPGPGVVGTGTVGVKGTGTTGAGLEGASTSGNGVLGETASITQAAILGRFTGSVGLGIGIVGQGGVGVQGEGTMNAGIVGTSLGSVGGHFSGGEGNLFLVPEGASPVTNTGVQRGTIVEDANGDLWLAVGTSPQLQDPGIWRKLAGPETAGSLHLLPAPKRVYDSRAGQVPLDVTKGAFVNQTRVIDATNNSSGVPLGATGVLVQFAVTGTNSGGFGTLYAVGQPDPGTASINWGLPTSLNNAVVTAVDANGDFNCKIAGTAHVIIDVVGYYR